MVGAAAGDAVTQMAMNLRSSLRGTVESDLFAWNIDPALHGDVIPLVHMPLHDPERLVIYHASIGQPQVTRLLLELGSRLVLHYHNITPASYFAGSRPEFAALLAWGRRELVLLREHVVATSAVSDYNAEELRTLGYRNVLVCPVGADPERLLFAPLDIMGSTARQAVGPRYTLAVAQQLPHKRVELLLESQAILERFRTDPPGLVIVGRPRDESYATSLSHAVNAWGLQKVWFTGQQTDSALASLFRGASALVSTSDHEGFCVPLLEAMAFGVPVVARACAAVPATVGEAGILLPAESGPAVLAEAISLVHDDPALRRELARAGVRRVESFRREATIATYLDFLAEVV